MLFKYHLKYVTECSLNMGGGGGGRGFSGGPPIFRKLRKGGRKIFHKVGRRGLPIFSQENLKIECAIHQINCNVK